MYFVTFCCLIFTLGQFSNWPWKVLRKESTLTARYADDAVVLADNIQDLQEMMDRIVQYSESFGLRINTTKTKLMIFSKAVIPAHLTIKGTTVEQIQTYKYTV